MGSSEYKREPISDENDELWACMVTAQVDMLTDYLIVDIGPNVTNAARVASSLGPRDNHSTLWVLTAE